ncbi:unnamed protein product [Phyllotreta striolata]|uniref:Uncharacterized protein n=1 Tax=Phyllotreta striolata TaxID=444603 RepID=A0A9N9TNJ0_PHYSR|nr:unnamed protein product [Phyllotreta striolata]
MMLVLCLLLLSPSLSTQENTTVLNVSNETISEESTNSSPVFRNESIDSSTVVNQSKPLLFNDFKPSPQLNSAFQLFEETGKSRTSFIADNWHSNEWGDHSKTPSKVKFPSTSSAERPYKFDTGVPMITQITNSIDYPFNQTPSPQGRPQDSLWKKIFGFAGPNSKQKTFYDNDEEEPPPYHNYYQQEYHHHQPMQYYRNKISPIKKIFKILATIIPIGFLLSALTPTLVTITPVNTTTTRINRKEEIVVSSLEKLKRDGCEEKVFCELILNAMLSKNAEEHVKNLLNNFVHRKGHENRDTTIKILEAVKNKDCSPLICHMLEDPI